MEKSNATATTTTTTTTAAAAAATAAQREELGFGATRRATLEILRGDDGTSRLVAHRTAEGRSAALTLTPTAAGLLALAIDSPTSKMWSLKGGTTALQSSGVLAPIVGARTAQEAAVAAAVNQFLKPLWGFGLRVIRFHNPEKGRDGYFAVLTLAGR